MISMIFAYANNHVIGDKGTIPWRCSEDLKFFKEKTMGHMVIMGRKTFESIGKPLPGRTNVILTRDNNYDPGFENVIVAHSVEEAVNLTKADKEAFIIGGSNIYRQFLFATDRIYSTAINKDYDGDTKINEDILDMTFCMYPVDINFEEGIDKNTGEKLFLQFKITQINKWDFSYETLNNLNKYFGSHFTCIEDIIECSNSKLYNYLYENYGDIKLKEAVSIQQELDRLVKNTVIEINSSLDPAVICPKDVNKPSLFELPKEPCSEFTRKVLSEIYY